MVLHETDACNERRNEVPFLFSFPRPMLIVTLFSILATLFACQPTNPHSGKFVTLQNISYRIRPGCRDHRPWPQGLCSKCQPSSITLELQPYRHVDSVLFENAQIIERFLDYWRQTRCQRIGILLGRYSHLDSAGSPPLAIKATVMAIYEPPQVAGMFPFAELLRMLCCLNVWFWSLCVIGQRTEAKGARHIATSARGRPTDNEAIS